MRSVSPVRFSCWLCRTCCCILNLFIAQVQQADFRTDKVRGARYEVSTDEAMRTTVPSVKKIQETDLPSFAVEAEAKCAKWLHEIINSLSLNY